MTRAVDGRDAIPPVAGSHVLVLRASRKIQLQAGALGGRRLSPGWYLYLGSARGPAGCAPGWADTWTVGARLHWHIDVLRSCTRPTAAWFQPGEAVVDCGWAQVLGRGRGIVRARPGFGSTGCGCPGHFFSAPSPCPGVRLPGDCPAPDWLRLDWPRWSGQSSGQGKGP